MSILLALLAQIGPVAAPRPVSQLPPEIRDRREQPAAPARPAAPAAPPPDEFDRCLAGARADPLTASESAQDWLGKAQGAQKAQAGHCLGVALAGLLRWEEAEAVFIAARDSTGDNVMRARLGAMAGNAALARGDAEAALGLLDAASGEADLAGDAPLTGDVELDRARALVALGRGEEAVAALSRARSALPGSAEAWLLSATLSRRLGRLGEAQAQIEKAAELMPVDPEIGLEAGVIAMLAGREDAARKSWRSVVAAAPQSPAAVTARGYLAQTGGD